MGADFTSENVVGSDVGSRKVGRGHQYRRSHPFGRSARDGCFRCNGTEVFRSKPQETPHQRRELTDSFSEYDKVLEKADLSANPWDDGEYVPDWDLLRGLLEIPIGAGKAESQQSGATAKAFDSWIAHELRRAGFPEDAVWPRRREPRVLPADLRPLEKSIEELGSLLDEHEKQSGARLRPVPLRRAIKSLSKDLPGSHSASILGRFYSKQVDVAVSAWQHGPDVLISTKTMFSSFQKNKNNRYEEALGEAPNLRDRYPLAAMGFAFLVRNSIYNEQGAFELLRDLLARLRRPHGPFDATMLIVAEWGDDLELGELEQPAELLTAPRFFNDLLEAAMANTPADVHRDVRVRKRGRPKGGVPVGDDDLGESPSSLD